jgi:beta-galactosidase
MHYKKMISVLLVVLSYWSASRATPVIQNVARGRQVITLNTDWLFHFAYNFEQGIAKEPVNLPHTWNAKESLQGIADYKRSSAIYERILEVPRSWQGRRLFLNFEGVNSVAAIFVNQKMVAEHIGGYTAFSLEITEAVHPGKNVIMVQVSNAYRLDVLPLHGDFNVYGGIHRPVSLLITDQNYISPIDYGSSGVYLQQLQVSEERANLSVLTKLSLKNPVGLSLRSRVTDQEGNVIATETTGLGASGQTELSQAVNIAKPHLWNGKQDPYLYHVEVCLLKDGQVVDQVVQPLGLRYFKVDPEKGFYLNGRYLNLYGVGRHEDMAGKGSALSDQDQEADMGLLLELGATAARLTHYPHGKHFYDLCDQNGIVLWSEIPFVGPGGYTGTGYVNTELLRSNVKHMLTELIRQNYNHPSVCFWGLFNELKLDFDDPRPFIQELNALAKTEDPSRLTTLASNLGANEFTELTDLMAWNKYYGWYGGQFSEIGKWADQTHSLLPLKPIAVSEYGAGGSPFKHTGQLLTINPKGRFHPEEWQTAFHENYWQELKNRPFIWGKFIWVLADFGSSIRTEGDTDGINDKGLVTYNRKLKKDAFYFYKANWNAEPMLYLTEKRNNKRLKAVTTVKVFCNLPEASLWINDRLIGTRKKDEWNTMKWDDVSLKNGQNQIVVRAEQGGKVLVDRCIWDL